MLDASGQGGAGVGTAGLSLLGDSADLESRLDAAFTDWDSIGAWTFEKVTESGSTVGEIRSRELVGSWNSKLLGLCLWPWFKCDKWRYLVCTVIRRTNG